MRDDPGAVPTPQSAINSSRLPGRTFFGHIHGDVVAAGYLIFEIL
jgi:hypothetical protein